jgi:hypothetical protein
VRPTVAVLAALLSLQFGAGPLLVFHCRVTDESSLSCCCEDEPPASVKDDCCEQHLVQLLKPDARPSQGVARLDAPPAHATVVPVFPSLPPRTGVPAAKPSPHPRPPPATPLYLSLRALLV